MLDSGAHIVPRPTTASEPERPCAGTPHFELHLAPLPAEIDVTVVPFMEPTAEKYYESALSLLRFIEQRSPTQRRFGPQADAAWAQFRGDLTTADRIQLMLADAHAQWPGSLGASTVYAMPGVAPDDAFGPDWRPLDGVSAEDLWRAVLGREAPGSLRSALEAAARAWGVTLQPASVPSIQPGQPIVAAGPSAVAALIEIFAGNSDLNWSRQVLVIATPPGHRQLAAAAAALLNLTEPMQLHSASTASKRRASAMPVVSADADARDAARAQELAG